VGRIFADFMKIAIITKRFHTNLYYTVKAMQDAGHTVELLVWYQGFSEKHDIINPFVVGYSAWSPNLLNAINKIKSAKLRNFWKYKLPFINLEEMIDFRRLKSRLKEIKPDVILARAYPNLTFFLMIRLSVKFCRKVFLMAQTSEHYGETIAKKIYLLVLKTMGVKGLITPLKNSLAKKDNFFIYLPFVIEAPDLNKEYFKNNKINIFSIGKFFRRKDHLLLLEAINSLKEKYDLSLTILGEKVEENIFMEIKDYIDNNNLNNIVEVKANVPFDEARGIFKNQDLFILPSYNEPAAYSPLEAMAAKLPVIVSDTCGTSCYIKEGENGYVFKSHDEKDLAGKIEKIIADRDKLRLMSEAAFRTVQTEHSLKVFSAGFAEIIKKL
jgi:glycosyltransferase involved in cell wall biosynthesis